LSQKYLAFLQKNMWFMCQTSRCCAIGSLANDNGRRYALQCIG